MKILTLAITGAAIAAGLSARVGAIAQVAGDAANPAASSAQTAKPGDADGAFVTAARFNERTGEQMYRRVCAACHMPDATGAQGAGAYPALARNPKLAAGGYPVYVVVRGLNGMPALGSMMSDQQVADVVNYVRTHFGNGYKDAVSAGDVKAVR